MESKRTKVELRSNKNNLIKREKGDYKYDRQDVYGSSGCNRDVNVSEGKAYEIIRMLNAELKEKGYIVVRGKVNTKYFFKKLIYNEE